MVFLLVITLLVGPGNTGQDVVASHGDTPSDLLPRNSQPYPAVPVKASVLAATEDSGTIADLIEAVEPAVVRIDVTGLNGQGMGSGFFIDEMGIIVTNHHVIEGALRTIVTTADGSTLTAVRVAQRPEHDLALIKVNPGKIRIRPLRVAVTLPRKGDEVIAIGAPLGLEGTATHGIVSAIRSGDAVPGALTLIQTTTPISPGNSGGPLINRRAEVVGVNTLAINGDTVQGLNFAVSSPNLQEMLKLTGR